MNELTFVIALFLEKGLLTPKEARELHKVAVNGSLNNSLSQMMAKVRIAVEAANTPPIANVKFVDAKDVLKLA